MQRNLSESFAEARIYGRVDIFTADDGTYSCNIDFNTIEHTKLQAKSGFQHASPEAAVEAALEAAKRIVEHVAGLGKRVAVPGDDWRNMEQAKVGEVKTVLLSGNQSE